MDLSDSPLPLYFGKRHDLFGWQYSSLPQDSRPLGIVIVAPHGYEMMSMHWGLRRCAERLNAAGYPVIRFDLLGVGNSLGDERQPDQVAAWLDSIHQAVDFLKQSSGVANIVVLGVRLGATLAAQVAAAREDISGIILYAPCITGRQYVREMRAFAATIKDAPEP
ncbi:MAG TPA: alpha/beta fold hydrolase, partial [Steroidobacteraceae bacterium]|nr:alpha/beta fold hydrolase [Steroidobacteraceae bacterium]